MGVSFLVPKQGKIVLTFGMFSGNQSDVPNDDCYKIIDETIKEFEKENKELLKTIKAQEEQIRLLKQLIENQDKIIKALEQS